MKKKLLLILLLVSAVQFDGLSQLYPVTGSVVMPYPSPIFLTDYHQAGNTKLQLNLTLNDFSIPSHDVKLKFTISNGAVELQTKTEYIPAAPITMTPGVPLLLQGSDLSDALQISNLNLSGITQAFLSQNGGKLPEGQYDFCVEVLDYASGNEVSLPFCTTVFLQLDQPPVISTPICGDAILPSNPQQIMFNWQTIGASQPSSGGFNTFKLSLYEITDPDTQDPQNAVMNSMAVLIYEADNLMQTTFNLDFSTVILVPGKRYVYRIKATGPNGAETFANDGYSEWCWFSYGYQEGGVIELLSPFDEYQFGKSEDKVFSWGVSDKGMNGQPYDYKLTIVELNDQTQDLEDALLNNASFHEEVLPTTTMQDGGNFLLQNVLTPDRTYAWRVEAFSEGQKVAESLPWSFHSHALIEYFFASNHKVKVLQTSNQDLSSLSGECRIQIGEDEQSFVDVPFSDLQLYELTGRYILQEGEVNFDLSEIDDVTLQADQELNGTANFKFVSGKINNQGLLVDGVVEWLLPQAVKSGEEQTIVSEQGSFSVNGDGQLSGETDLVPFHTVLLNPIDIEVDLTAASYFAIGQNTFYPFLKGTLKMPERIKSTDNGNPVVIEIKDHVTQFDYFELGDVYINGGIKPFENINLNILPTTNATVDFSESQSPGSLSGNTAWKGIYFEDAEITVANQGFDESNQLKVQAKVQEDFSASSSGNKFRIDNDGLTLNAEVTGIDSKYNTFPTTSHVVIKINKGEYDSCYVKGAITIPFIDANEEHGFKIKLKESELSEQGFLNTDFDGYLFKFNPFGGENKVDLAINGATFKDNEYIELNMNLEWPELDLQVDGLDDFRIYGDNAIGFGGKAKSVVLSSPAQGQVKSVDLEVTEIGASYSGTEYGIAYIGSLDMGETIVDNSEDEDAGSPVFNGASVVEIDSDFADSQGSYGSPTIPVPALSDMTDATKIQLKDIHIKIESAIVDGEGVLKYKSEDPEWGTWFEAGVDLDIKLPVEVNCGGHFIYGKKDELDYWYADAYYEDVTGEGLAVTKATPIFNIVGVEGRIYHHMSTESTELERGEEIVLSVDEDLLFGGALYAQVIDAATLGFNMQGDVGLLVEMEGSVDELTSIDVSASMKASFLNTSGVRSPGAAGSVTNQVAETVGEEVANQVIGNFFPQEFEISGVPVTVDAENLKHGSVTIGDLTSEGIMVEADINSTPGGKFELAKDDISIKGSGDLNGNGEMTLKYGSDITAFGELVGQNEAALDVELHDKGIHVIGNGNLESQSGALDLTYEDYQLGLSANVQDQSGAMDVVYGEYQLHGMANASNKSGELGFAVGSELSLELAGDASAKTGAFSGSYSGYEFSGTADAEAMSGTFEVSQGGKAIVVGGSPSSGKFEVEDGSDYFKVMADLEGGHGKLNTKFDDYQIDSEISQDQGKLYLKNNQKEVDLAANFDGSAGKLKVKDDGLLFNIEADKSAEIGKLDFAFDSENIEVNSMFNPNDSSYVSLKMGENIKEAAITSENNSFLHLKEGDEDYSLYLNPGDQIGNFNVTRDVQLNGFFNKPAQALELNYEKDGDQMYGNMENEALELKYLVGSENFEITKDEDGGGKISYKNDGSGVTQELGYNAADQAGLIHLEYDGKLLHAEGNLTEQTALLELNTGSEHIKAEDQDTVNLVHGPFSATFDKASQDGEVRYDDNGIGLSAGKSGDRLQIGLSKEEKQTYFGYNIADNKAFAEYDDDMIGIDADYFIDDKKGVITLQKDNYSIGFTGYPETGDGQVTVSDENITITVGGNPSEKKGNFAFENSEKQISVDGYLDEPNDDLIFNLSVPEHSIYLEHTTDLKAIKLEKENVAEVVVNSTSESQDAHIKVDGDRTIFAENTSTEQWIGYRDSGTEIAVGTKFELNYDNRSLRFLLNHLYLDDVEIPTMPDSINGSIDTIPFTVTYIDTIQMGDAEVRVYANGTEKSFTMIRSDIDSVRMYTDNYQAFELDFHKGDIEVHATKDADNMSVQYNEYALAMSPTNKSASVNWNDEYQLALSENSVDANILDQYLFRAKKGHELFYQDEERLVDITMERLAVEAEGKIVELSSDKSMFVQYATDKKVSLNLIDGLALTYEDKNLIANPEEKKVVYTSNDESMGADESGVVIIKDGKEAGISIDSVYVKNGTEQFASFHITEERLTVGHEEYLLSADTEKKIMIRDADKILKVNPESLYFAQDEKAMFLSQERISLKMSDTDSIFVTSEKEMGLYTDGHEVELKVADDPYFNYAKEDRYLNLTAESVSIGEGSGSSAKGLFASMDSIGVDWDDNFAHFTQTDLDFKYNQYSGGYNEWEFLKASNGVQHFAVSKDSIEVFIDENNFASVGIQDFHGVPVPLINMKKDDYRFMVGTDVAEIDYEGKRYHLGKEDVYMSIHDIADETNPEEMIILTDEGIEYPIANTPFTVYLLRGDKLVTVIDTSEYQARYDLDFDLNSRFEFTKEGTHVGKLIFNDGDPYGQILVTDSTHLFDIYRDYEVENVEKTLVSYSYVDVDARLALEKFNDGGKGVQAFYSSDEYRVFANYLKDEYIEIGGKVPQIDDQVSTKIYPDTRLDLNLGNPTLPDEGLVVELVENSVQYFGCEWCPDPFTTYGTSGSEVENETESVTMDGPQNISEISEDAAGWAFTEAQATLSIDPQDLSSASLVINGDIKTGLTIPVFKTVGEVPFKFTSDEDGFEFKLAEENSKAQMKVYGDIGPTYSAFAKLTGDSDGIDARFGFGAEVSVSDSWSKSLKIAGVGCTFKASYSANAAYDVIGDVSIGTDGSLDFKEASAAVDAGVTVSASGCGLGTSASATVKGTLKLTKTEDDKINLKGTVKASAKVSGYTASFEEEVDLNL